jgi:protein-arginine kinase activator protein McsA
MDEEIKLNKFEKEKRVIELHKQGKTIKEIAKEVHMAFRDISKIIKKYEYSIDENKKTEDNLYIKILSLFHKGKKPIEVAISLKLNCNQVEESYKDFWKLNNFYTLLSVYEDIKDEIPFLVEVYQIFKEKGILGKEIITWVGILHEISNLEEYREKLKKQIRNYEEKCRYG